LSHAVHSHFIPEVYSTEAAWNDALKSSTVRLQWDPDYDPVGAKVGRRAIQLGLRGAALIQYARDWIDNIEDISEFVAEQSYHANTRAYEKLLIPHQEPYSVPSEDVAKRLGISNWP
jgi:hypothetical protein